MERQRLKEILSNYYSKDGVKSILCGRMKPSYEVMLKLNETYKIPFTVWQDIKSYINENISSVSKNKQLQDEDL